jgi:hypothetical protein
MKHNCKAEWVFKTEKLWKYKKLCNKNSYNVWELSKNIGNYDTKANTREDFNTEKLYTKQHCFHKTKLNKWTEKRF